MIKTKEKGKTVTDPIIKAAIAGTSTTAITGGDNVAVARQSNRREDCDRIKR